MFKLTVCLLTYNSARLLHKVLAPLMSIADEFIAVDSGSSDETLVTLQEYGITPIFHPYAMHGEQMNIAISRSSNDWVLCMDSDEILDEDTIHYILALKSGDEPSADCGWSLSRYWYVLGERTRTIYPISSPDFPLRLFNRQNVRFNNRPVDDKAVGAVRVMRIPGHVRHDTFYSLHEVFNKLNVYTTRVVKYQMLRPSIARGVVSAIGAFFKWYLFSGAWRQGKVGVVTGVYATLYSFLKYFKAWYQYQDEKESAARKNTDSHLIK
ncbi:glycosyltransferase family 2 protein [Enterobacter kobei]|uniref:glycosyltransferase family 2 protein n=1 Tax=Enterobacter kobei TaxID=208224 RepID=UPI000903ACF7|nr:glycosyltransferase family 2 protein [Enterobacter kobei]OJH27196.1 family 2 glycosyl transferase [Enterobacter kobei]